MLQNKKIVTAYKTGEKWRGSAQIKYNLLFLLHTISLYYPIVNAQNQLCKERNVKVRNTLASEKNKVEELHEKSKKYLVNSNSGINKVA